MRISLPSLRGAPVLESSVFPLSGVGPFEIRVMPDINEVIYAYFRFLDEDNWSSERCENERDRETFLWSRFSSSLLLSLRFLVCFMESLLSDLE